MARTKPKPPAQERRDTGLPVKRLSVDMPGGLHRRFKAACAAAGLAMGEQVVLAIGKRVAELEKK
jgi:hypothetical protein